MGCNWSKLDEMVNNDNEDYLNRLFLRPSSPQKFITPVYYFLLEFYYSCWFSLYKFQRGSPQTTPTKYRPDGGDRYIPIRQSESEWMTKYASISLSPPLDSINSIPVKKLFAESSNQLTLTREAPPSNSNNSTHNAASLQNEDSGHDIMTHRALLKNELLRHSIIDIRVCFSFKMDIIFKHVFKILCLQSSIHQTNILPYGN